MNDRAREALVAAALSGVPQITHNYRDLDGGSGRCAMGVLYEAAGLIFHSQHTEPNAFDKVSELFDVSRKEEGAIMRANDDDKWDFLTIARKIGNTEENV